LKNALLTPELERLVGRAVLDKEFRDTLLANPAATAKNAGFILSPEEIANLNTINATPEGFEKISDTVNAWWA
jgi:hypothetical protein